MTRRAAGMTKRKERMTGEYLTNKSNNSRFILANPRGAGYFFEVACAPHPFLTAFLPPIK